MLPPVEAPALFVAALGFGYLLGSIPFGVIFTQLAGTGDIRAIGSGNIGATNVLRTGRKGLAAATLLGDALKGTIATLALTAFNDPYAPLAAGFGAFIGHLFPVWLKFKGGKGVATYIGVLFALAWPVGLLFCVIWLAIAAVTRYSSLAGLIASAAVPIALYVGGWRAAAVLFVVLTVMLWVRHHENIARLLRGTEGKIARRAAAPPAA
jgi:acyl phosphate:glycerol-3-phosphate acyltransferase